MTKKDLEGKSLEELTILRRKVAKEFDWITVGGCLGYPLLAFASNNDVRALIGGAIAILIPELKTIRDIISLEGNFDYYYCHSKEYQEAYVPYNILLEEIIKMFHSLGWDNGMSIFAGYSYLFKQGYLSLSHEFYYSKFPSDIPYFLGSNIILGEGNYRNINTMLKDLLRYNGYSAYSVGINVDKPIISLVDIPLKENLVDTTETFRQNIPDLDKKNNWLVQILTYFIYRNSTPTNHQVTLWKEKNSSCLLDACNDTLFLVDNERNIYQNGKAFLVDKNANRNKFRNMEEKIKLDDLLIPSKREIKNHIKEHYYGVMDSCLDYHDTFEKFYQEHKELYEEVLSKRRSLKKAVDKYPIIMGRTS